MTPSLARLSRERETEYQGTVHLTKAYDSVDHLALIIIPKQ